MESDQAKKAFKDSKLISSSNNVSQANMENTNPKCKENIPSTASSLTADSEKCTETKSSSSITLKETPATHLSKKNKDCTPQTCINVGDVPEKSGSDEKENVKKSYVDNSSNIGDRLSLCDRCSESMLSYVSLLGELLQSITIDIVNKSIPSSQKRKNQCPFCIWEETKEKFGRGSPTSSDIIQKSEIVQKAEKKHDSESCIKHPRDQFMPKRIVSGHANESPGSQRHQQNTEKRAKFSTGFSMNFENRAVQTDVTFKEYFKDNQVYSSKMLDEVPFSKSTENVSDRAPFIAHSTSSSIHQSQGINKESSEVYDTPASCESQIYQFKGSSSVDTKSQINLKSSHEKSSPLKKKVFHVEDESHLSRSSRESKSPYECNVLVTAREQDISHLTTEQTFISNQNPIFSSRRRSFNGEFEFPESIHPESGKEAYVTMAIDNLSALKCLVLGYSLKLSNTDRTLVVLIADGVTRTLRQLLSTVFHQVQPLNSLDSLGITKLALLKQPELGVSFFKLHVWLLTSFTKCIYLDPDTLVVQNCDELFERDELSAVPDIGWPDCFNSGVFVYVPSLNTFWSLITFLEEHGTYDGGDQGLLNMYFSSWNQDIKRKLPFIYNLMANVSYTYSPAFKQFGRNVKIVHFFGNYKPVTVPFHSSTGQLAPSSKVHPTFAQFVHIWLTIFHKLVFPSFPIDIQGHFTSSTYTSAAEFITFIPGVSISEAQDVLPIPPSFRMYRPTVHQMIPQDVYSTEESSFGKENPPSEYQDTKQEAFDENNDDKSKEYASENVSENYKIREHSDLFENIETSVQEESDLEENLEASKTDLLDKRDAISESTHNYDGRLAFEQGKIDYMGRYKSDNILERLNLLIKNAPK